MQRILSKLYFKSTECPTADCLVRPNSEVPSERALRFLQLLNTTHPDFYINFYASTELPETSGYNLCSRSFFRFNPMRLFSFFQITGIIHCLEALQLYWLFKLSGYEDSFF